MTKMPDVPARPATLTELFFTAVERTDWPAPALRYKRGGAWQDMSRATLLDRVANVSVGLLERGIRAGDRIAILSENRPEWAIADYGCLAARAVDVPIYPTLTPRQILYILNDCGARGVFVSNPDLLAKLTEIRSEAPKLEWIVTFNPEAAGGEVVGFSSLEDQGQTARARYPDWRRDALASDPNDLATIIYTSGTTGEPKGVMLSHRNIAFNVRSGMAILPVGPTDRCLSLLPLSHIFERMVGHYSMLHAGATINYAESLETVTQDLLDVQPTIVPAVPRLYEKIYARVTETALHGSPVKRAIFQWARRVGEQWANHRSERRSVPWDLSFRYAIADRLVFSKLRKRVGGRLRFFISGGAPLAPEIARFFYAAKMPILEGYGLTETSPVITVNTPDQLRFGTVGPAIPGVEVKIAEDGEILTRSPSVMLGYFNKPEATTEAIDQEGWFHTGDIGEVDRDGFLRITDRKKDLIATAGGKKIAPQPIEAMLKQNKYIANAVLLGDRRKFPILLIAPEFAALEQWAKEHTLQWSDRADLVKQERVQRFLADEAKKHMRDLARFEVPKKFLVIPREFSIESGELTPKLSVRRKIVEEHYKDEIEALYLEPEPESGALRQESA